jgi:two-component system, chemotaxis family, protein-glutamate methylesterase/glutaminase
VPKKIRVLVVEDSATVRSRFVEILNAEPDIEVIGEAGDGKCAIDLCRRARPDIITMDMMLPVMSGLAATEYIMAHCPTPILVVSASINRGELFKIYEALTAGAVDVLEKPNGTESAGAWESRFTAMVRLVARIRVITHLRARLAAFGNKKPPRAPRTPDATRPDRACSLVAVGASTGGPGAVLEILRALPAQFRLPILLVLHINEPFGSAFADWLDAQTKRPVAYARDGMPVISAAGRVLVAPTDRHLIVRDGYLRLTHDPERHCCRPSVDVLFESVAMECGASAAACLLTGMGRDGALGLLKVRQAGGLTIAQDEATSVVYGMPREAALLGAAWQVLSLGEIGPRLAALQSADMEAEA